MNDSTSKYTSQSIFGLLSAYNVEWSIYGYNNPPLTRLNLHRQRSIATACCRQCPIPIPSLVLATAGARPLRTGRGAFAKRPAPTQTSTTSLTRG